VSIAFSSDQLPQNKQSESCCGPYSAHFSNIFNMSFCTVTDVCIPWPCALSSSSFTSHFIYLSIIFNLSSICVFVFSATFYFAWICSLHSCCHFWLLVIQTAKIPQWNMMFVLTRICRGVTAVIIHGQCQILLAFPGYALLRRLGADNRYHQKRWVASVYK